MNCNTLLPKVYFQKLSYFFFFYYCQDIVELSHIQAVMEGF